MHVPDSVLNKSRMRWHAASPSSMHVAGQVVPALDPNTPIYAGGFSMQLIKRRMMEFNLWNPDRFKVFHMRERFQLGPFECVPRKLSREHSTWAWPGGPCMLEIGVFAYSYNQVMSWSWVCYHKTKTSSTVCLMVQWQLQTLQDMCSWAHNCAHRHRCVGGFSMACDAGVSRCA